MRALKEKILLYFTLFGFGRGFLLMADHIPLLHKFIRSNSFKGWFRRYKYRRHYGRKKGDQIARESSSVSCVLLPHNNISVELRPGDSDYKVFEHIFINEAYQMNLSQFPARWIVDGGANIGLASLYFALKYPDAKILAVEPQKENYEQLVANTSAFKSIQPVCGAVWPSTENVTICNPDASAWSYRVQVQDEGKSKSCSVQGFTIPSLMEKGGFNAIDLLKLDIEGAERYLFREDCSWLNKVLIMVIELHDWIVPGCSQAIYPVMSRMGFCSLHSGENVIFVNRLKIKGRHRNLI